MSRWGKMFDWLRVRPAKNTPSDESDESGELEPAPPVVLASEEERWLGSLAEAVAVGERLTDVGSPAYWSRINGLWERGDEKLAAELVEKFIAIPTTPPPTVTALRAKLVEMFDSRGDIGEVIDHLEVLVQDDEHALRANFILGDHYRRRGDEARALRHYEAVLARDVDYPNVKGRVDRIRSRRGQASSASVGATIVGPDAHSGGVGARYRLVRELGRGATGVVYLARDIELERDVAIKLLHPHLSAAEKAQNCAAFFTEARIAASLRHPNIMAILDIDERARRIVLELAAGGTLRTVLRDRGARPLRRALERHVQVLSALSAAHRRGIVHRDLKPANLMFRRDPDALGSEVILGDFGIAHLPDAEGAEPETRDAVGTLAYMAPEQRRAEDVDPKWDLYASAAVLYEMITGALPWSRRALLEGIRLRGDFALPADRVSTASAELARALKEHLDDLGDPNPDIRPDTAPALQVARELRDLAIAESAAQQ